MGHPLDPSQQSVAGDQPDFADIHETFRQAIHDYLLRLTREPSEAEDLTQEVFLRVHRGLAKFRGDAQLKTWIYRIASNAFIDHKRSAADRRRQATRDVAAAPQGDWEDDDSPRPDETSMRQEEATCIQNYVAELPPHYGAVLVMHDMDGLTNPEIAEVLECSLDTAKIRLHRARKKLKDAMERGCDFSQDRRGNLLCDPKQGHEKNPHCP